MANIRAKHNDTLPVIGDQQWSDLQVDGSGRLVVTTGPANDPGALTLLTTAAVTGAGVAWLGGNGAFFASGTWDTATVTLEWSPNNSTWYSLGSAFALSANGFKNFSAPSGFIRLALTSPGGTTSVSATARYV